MKKVILAAAIATALVAGGASASFAATSTAKPSVKNTAGAEGTAKHEMSETSGTQKAEANKSAKSVKTKSTKKAKK